MPQIQFNTANAQTDLTAQLIATSRQRFKAEVNRLTSGAMAEMLGDDPDVQLLAFPLSYLYAFHWLRENVPEAIRPAVLTAFRGRPDRAALMDLLLQGNESRDFVEGYIRYWSTLPEGGPVQQRELLDLLAKEGGDPARLAERMLSAWSGLGVFQRDRKTTYAQIAKEERDRYRGMLSEPDLERLALVDAIAESVPPSAPTHFAKLGIIPAMGCPQTCRHCMFVWRPPTKDNPDTAGLYELVDSLTEGVLFTGGDLTNHLQHFERAIRTMPAVSTFAILLNGDFAVDIARTRETLGSLAQAIRSRPTGWAKASILLQISFDEMHQEVIVDKHGEVRERIPVAKIANIVEVAVSYPQIQLCLAHKQSALNFSMDLFHSGVFGRLAAELGRRGHQLQVLSASPSPRQKRHPLDPGRIGQVIKDASFILTRHPERPILLTSSTIDGYGRAALLDPSETVNERDLLQQVLSGRNPGESFDTDLMFWHNGWVTLFSAVHIALGDLYKDGAETILRRHRIDPLTAALRVFDLRLLAFYQEIKSDLDDQVASATGPHHLFHMLTEDPQMRLHLTRRLLDVAN